MNNVTIRSMTPADICFGLQLGEIAGWNQLLVDWTRIYSYQPDGCFVAMIEDRPVGTITSSCYGTDLAWIGMMLVHPEVRRQGIATRLMEHVIAVLQKRGVQCIKLDATPAGAKVYEQLGFHRELDFHRYQLVDHQAETAPINSHTVIGQSSLDTEAFGVARSELLEKFSRDSTVVGNAEGFGMIRPGRLASYLGPVVCQNPKSANSLIEALLKQSSGAHFWDVPDPNSAARRIAQRFGFKPARPLTRMWLGEKLVTGRIEFQYALASPATG